MDKIIDTYTNILGSMVEIDEIYKELQKDIETLWISIRENEGDTTKTIKDSEMLTAKISNLMILLREIGE